MAFRAGPSFRAAAALSRRAPSAPRRRVPPPCAAAAPPRSRPASEQRRERPSSMGSSHSCCRVDLRAARCRAATGCRSPSPPDGARAADRWPARGAVPHGSSEQQPERPGNIPGCRRRCLDARCVARTPGPAPGVARNGVPAAAAPASPIAGQRGRRNGAWPTVGRRGRRNGAWPTGGRRGGPSHTDAGGAGGGRPRSGHCTQSALASSGAKWCVRPSSVRTTYDPSNGSRCTSSSRWPSVMPVCVR